MSLQKLSFFLCLSLLLSWNSTLMATPFIISSWGTYPDEQAFAIYTKDFPDGEYLVLMVRTLTLDLIVVPRKLPYSIKGKWAHIVFTFQKGIIKLYLDAELLGEPYTGSPPGTQMNMGRGIIYIGRGGIDD